MIGNEPAFPIIRHMSDALGEQYTEILSHGLSIRQYFVAQAMGSILQNCEAIDDATGENNKFVSEIAISVADACLAREAETREK
jgi:hypothetical protein